MNRRSCWPAASLRPLHPVVRSESHAVHRGMPASERLSRTLPLGRPPSQRRDLGVPDASRGTSGPALPGSIRFGRDCRSRFSGLEDCATLPRNPSGQRAEEHTSELQSLTNLVCRLLLEKKKDDETVIGVVDGRTVDLESQPCL